MSLVPSLTEALFTFGVEESAVGRVRYYRGRLVWSGNEEDSSGARRAVTKLEPG